MTLPLQIRVGRAVARLRAGAGYSQEAFALHVGVHRTYQGLIERGAVAVTVVTLEKLAAGLGIPVTRLLVEAERRQSNIEPPRRPGRGARAPVTTRTEEMTDAD